MKMGITIKTKLTAGFGILLLLFVGFSIVISFTMSSVQDEFTTVIENDAVVIANAYRLSKLIVDMETGQRGYCITQREEFLEPYNKAQTEFSRLLEIQRELVNDVPSQLAALKRIEDLVAEWQENAAKPEIEMAREISEHWADAQHLQDVLGLGTGKDLMDRGMVLAQEIELAFSDRADWEGAYVAELIEKCMATREDSQRGFLITGKESFLEKYVGGEQKNLPEHFDRLRAVISKRGRVDELLEKVDELEQLTQEWTKKAAEPEIAARREMNEHPVSLKDVAALLEAGTGKALIDQLRARIAGFIDVAKERAEQRYAAARATTSHARLMTLWLVIFTVAIGSAVAVLSIREICGSIGVLLEGTRIVGSGDLGHRIEVNSRDEIGQLGVSFNHMLEKRQRAEHQLNEEITHRKQVEDDLTEINEILGEQTARANDMAAQAEEANMAKSRFLANMSHELRTPMNAIVGFSDLLVDEDLSEEHKTDVRIIKTAAESLLNLINDILDFSKIEANQLQVERIDCSLGELLDCLESMMGARADEKSLDFKIVTEKDLPAQICSDPHRLHQCLLNLLSNAIKFTDQGYVHLKVSLHEDKSQHFIRFDIEDSGIGIPQDRQQAIFESFVQADGSTTRKFGGTGLGLTITKQLAELLGGELTLVSAPGQGSTFSLVTPTGVDIAGQPLMNRYNALDQGERKPGKVPATLFSGRVLVAEDVSASRKLMKLMLSKLGVEVVMAEDGIQALQQASSECFDLILMDMQMPHMSGYEATRLLRERGCKTPIVALTANAMKGDDQKCLEAGCDGYISKPIDRLELPRVLAKYMPAREDAASETWNSAPVQELASESLESNRVTCSTSSGELDEVDRGEIIDWNRLIEALGDEEIVRETIPSYIEDLQEQFVELSRAVEHGDCESMADHAHALKGIGGYLCLERISDLAGRMECSGRENDIEAGTLYLSGLKTEIGRIMTAVTQCDWFEQAKRA